MAAAGLDLLEACPAEPLQGPALDLPRGEDRVHSSADLHHGPGPDRADFQGIFVDLHFHDVGSPRVCLIRIAVIGRLVPGQAGGRLVDRLARDRSAIPGSARSREFASEVMAGVDQDSPDDHRRARGDRRPAVGDQRSVREGYAHPFQRHTQRLRRDLAQNGRGALAHIGAADQDFVQAVRITRRPGDEADMYAAGDLVLAGAGEAASMVEK